MLFNSPEFIFLFVPFAVLVHFGCARWTMAAAMTATVLSSFLFYGWWNPPFVALPILSIAANFALASRITRARPRTARWLLAAGIVANVLVLGWFKYADFIVSVASGAPVRAPDVPLALSFTTFVQVAFLLDAYRQRLSLDLPRYAMFVAFFPHLIAGPIVRWGELGQQIADKARYRPDWDNIALGLTIFTFGLAKKVLLADSLAAYVRPVFDAAARGEPVTAIAAWGGAFAFSGQVYFDFSGYSEMAIGLGLLFNLRLPINFAAPFRATSIIDFWRRWHVTLSRFLRDFVYVPLGGSRGGRARTMLNLVLTMTLGGLWHGAGWTFVLWGAFNGVLLALNHAWRVWRGPMPSTRLRRFAGCAATFLAFAVGIVIFRASDLPSAIRLLTAMAGFSDAAVPAHSALPWDEWIMRHGYVSRDFVLTWLGAHWSVVGTLVTAGALGIAFAVPETLEIVDYREMDEHARWRRHVFLRWRANLWWLMAMTALFFVTFGRMGRVSEFLYYQF